MFHYIRGKLALARQGLAVVEASGVGYRLTISDQTYQSISQKNNEEVRLYTHLSVREDDIELFGFAEERELDMFKLLITVSGVGPKAAMGVLSAFTPDKLVLAVCTDDKKAISKANGIGPKTAARIILELHDKLSDSAAYPISDGLSLAQVSVPAGGGKLAEAQEALTVLGYGKSEILTALQGVDVQSMSVEDIIRAALKKLMR